MLAIGPEGGIEADELEALVAAGFRPVRLGPTILRFETAAVAALAIARTALGALRGHAIGRRLRFREARRVDDQHGR